MPKQPAKRKRNAQQTWPNPNPALKDLEVLVGKWQLELTNSAFLPSLADKLIGLVSFHWLEDGAFLEMRQGYKGLGPPEAVMLIGRDEGAAEYRGFYYDSRGVSRIYNMTFHRGSWKMWRESPGFSQRYEGRFSRDRKTIKAYWEKSFDGANWEHDFDMTYRKTP